MIDTMLKEYLSTHNTDIPDAYVRGELYGSINSLHSSSAMLYARTLGADLLPGLSHKFLKVTLVFKAPNESESIELYLCALNWLLEHPQKKWFHSPAEVWRVANLTAQPNIIIPGSNIKCRCAYTTDHISFKGVQHEYATKHIIEVQFFY